MIEVAWATDEPLLADEEVVRVVQAALEHGGRPGIALEITFVGEELLTELHEQHLGDPSATDDGFLPHSETNPSFEAARGLGPPSPAAVVFAPTLPTRGAPSRRLCLAADAKRGGPRPH